MNISRKIGLSLVITLFLSIVLGVLSIYSLKLTYRNLEEVLNKDVPVIKLIGEIELDFASAINNAVAYVNTNAPELKSKYEDLFGSCRANLDKVRGIVDDKYVRSNLELILNSYLEITDMVDRLAITSEELNKKLEDGVNSAQSLRQIISGMIKVKEDEFKGKEEMLLLQSEYVPAVSSLKRLENLIPAYITNLRLLILTDNTWYQDEIFSIEKDIDMILMKYQSEYLSQANRDSFTAFNKEYGFLKSCTEVLNTKFSYRNELVVSLFISADDFTGSLSDILSAKRVQLFKKAGLTAVISEYVPTTESLVSIGVSTNRFLPLLSKMLFSGNEEDAKAYYDLSRLTQAYFNDYKKHIVNSEQEARIDKLLDKNMQLQKRFDDILMKNSAFTDKVEVMLENIRDIENTVNQNMDFFVNGLSHQLDADIFRSKYMAAISVLQDILSLNNQVRFSVFNYLYTGKEEFYNDYTGMYFTIRSQIKNYERNFMPSEKVQDIKKIEQDLDAINDAVVKMSDFSSKEMKSVIVEALLSNMQWNSMLQKSVNMEYEAINESRKTMLKKQKAVNLITILIILGIMGISVFIAFYTTENITLPIKKLTAGVKEVANGKLGFRLHIHTDDEIEELSKEFNKMAKELDSLYKNLERKVIERTVELAETNRVLEDANQELDDFTYVVSHDLKEPLRGITAFSNFLKDEYSDKLDEQANEYITTIVSSANRMSTLISDLLNLSRLTRTKNPYEEVDLNAVLAEVRESLKFAISEKGVELITEDLPFLVCDKVRISEVFFNLISNALKFMDKERPVVRIGYEDDADYYKFFVNDNGIGIPEKDKDKIFQIFKRLHTREQYEGTGAGLTIVKKIVESHGGYIWVESTEGEGSTFYFTVMKNLRAV